MHSQAFSVFVLCCHLSINGSADLDGIVSSTLKLMQDAEPDRFKEGFPEALLNNVKKTAVFLVDHHRYMCHIILDHDTLQLRLII